ncbi:23S rRNA (guanosine(2251)-2'-O)-methyltransferase RlmB [Actinomadura spongiicola]|uniref:23S rRNA (Guanosine(2251)-2'-O)-methyltransferase RlmB n=1 Tax=Actinomadura spongiicola TaxID=2303421 RepID=A0A372GEA8_9ACTN|nr:23S rRNA (guanosine(2251)-2'-O)-methyltransferase RlmB [Actinomadura spongiicola]RFS83728.1 23S rRNA (guanosine(2251)-2'-O)-methyltransferase RlmB [Actinomadura spongiicola]
MAKRKGKGPTPKAEDRHWYGKRQKARAVKSAKRTGTSTLGPGSRLKAESRERPGRPGTGRPAGARRASGEVPELVTGRNPVVEALRAGVPGTALYVTSGTDERVRESIQLAADRRIPLLETARPELDRLTDGAVHQGIALQVKPYRYAHPDDLLTGPAPLIVAVDGITDPRNLGAIVRSAAAFGASGVVVPERRAAGVTAGTWKSSAGTLATVPVAQATNLTRQLKAYQKAGCFVAGLDAHGEVTVADLEVASGPFVLVIGSEGKGLGRLVAETCDLLVMIPMPGTAESLNAGVAAGIALYEVSRRRP